MTKTLETERLLLRPYRASDAEAMAQQLGEFAVSKWLTRVPHPYGTADALAFFDKVADTPMVYAVCRIDAVMGCVSIMGGDLGYWFGAQHWGKGYATEAARAVVADYFAHTDTVLGSGYLVGNDGSRNVLEKLGFVPDCIQNTPCLSRGESVPNHRMKLSVDAWRAQP